MPGLGRCRLCSGRLWHGAVHFGHGGIGSNLGGHLGGHLRLRIIRRGLVLHLRMGRCHIRKLGRHVGQLVELHVDHAAGGSVDELGAQRVANLRDAAKTTTAASEPARGGRALVPSAAGSRLEQAGLCMGRGRAQAVRRGGGPDGDGRKTDVVSSAVIPLKNKPYALPEM